MWAHGQGAPPDEAAILEKISKPLKRGGDFQFYMVNALRGTITLDDQRMRNVIVFNAVIEYNGGQVDLNNVYFVNCIFRVRYTTNGMHLGDHLLASASTNFTVTS
jgi:hypothetical protein